MKVLVTGAGGFIGKNLICSLRENPEYEVIEYHSSMGLGALADLCDAPDIVFHLAGVNRPKSEEEFISGNVDFTRSLVDALEKNKNCCPVVFVSSTQAELDNAYGRSKKAAEDILLKYSADAGERVAIYRLTNTFGKWCRPNYNSVVATFCYNISHEIPIVMNDPARRMKLIYIDDVVNELMSAVGDESRSGFCEDGPCYVSTVREIAEIIKSFPGLRANLSVPDQSDDFIKKLYSTYLSYLPMEGLSYPLHMHEDERGSFTEFIRTEGQGQFSVNISRPHIVKGNHWHHTKHEKFLVVSGEGVIRLRKLGERDIAEYRVSGKNMEVVEIPPGYTHNIENTGDTDMVTVMWANENFDPAKPDTYAAEV